MLIGHQGDTYLNLSLASLPLQLALPAAQGPGMGGGTVVVLHYNEPATVRFSSTNYCSRDQRQEILHASTGTYCTVDIPVS
jgi:hypothetical protein